MNRFVFKSVGFVKFVLVIILTACSCVFFGFTKIDIDTGEVVMDLIGSFNVQLYIGDTYTDEGIVITHNGKDVSQEMVVTDDVDTSKIGEYHVNYTYKDITLSRAVVVQEAIPYILLSGQEDMEITLGEPYVESGFMAFDEMNQDITSEVTIDGSVNESVMGTYSIHYTAVTSRGVLITAERRIKVAPNSLSNALQYDRGFFDGAVFLGDSITVGLKSYVISKRKSDPEFLGDAQFLAENSYSIKAATSKKSGYYLHPKYNGQRLRPEDSLEKMQAQKVFIMMGVNDVTYSKSMTINNYKKLVDNIKSKSPNISIYIISIFPMTSSRESEIRNNQKISELNQMLLEYANTMNIPFIDMTQSFMIEGRVDASLYRDNYVHINSKGYEIYTSNLIEAAKLLNCEVQKQANESFSLLGQVMHVDTHANIRSTPSTDIYPVGQIEKNSYVEITPDYYNQFWYRIYYGDKFGYIYKELLY